MRLRFDMIYYLFRSDKLVQAHLLARIKHTNQWASNIRSTKVLGAEEIGNSEIIRELPELSLQEDYYRARDNLAKYVHRECRYEDFSIGDECFRAGLSDCNISHPENVAFTCERKIQRNSHDASRVDELRSYLGCR